MIHNTHLYIWEPFDLWNKTAGAVLDVDRLARGKRSIAVNLKDVKGQQLVQNLAASADVLIEPFRPGSVFKI